MELDKILEMRYYGLSGDGIGGYIRRMFEDFIVYEISIDGTLATPNCREIPQGAGEYTWVVVEKRGVDSVTAVRKIRKFLGLQGTDIDIAGLKDTTAVTFQFASIKGEVPAEAIEKFNSLNTRVKIHCPVRRPFHLRPGLLFGNRFTIRVRDCNTSRLHELLDELRRLGGVPNYFGYQRFGSIRPVTHVVGKRIIEGRFKEAVEELLLRIFPHESQRAKNAREYLASTGDFRGTLEIFPKTMKSERAIIAYLAERPRDYVGALRHVSGYIRKLFVGAYQAYLFNKVLSKRIERGLSWVYASPGDYVGVAPGSAGSGHMPVLMANDTNLDKVNKLIHDGRAFLLLPIFGYNTHLSQGEEGEIEKEVLREENIDVRSFYVKSLPEASSAGSYRPSNLSPLDLDVKVDSEGVVFSFALKKGMYATTLLREIVKPSHPVEQGF
ncbi:tRNA pseudouridine(13) synthase TruD [Infirmifilum lucidum]|uniref:Probable tRNA pseudouridine synthase D n=1 Tax=Infirmifilum lucidum TaxID=2776706 RepID=A0A7L9FL60_9CREN|nr:tRNA pseudouridine(13) synthase TruD [Infirmifilum lucidum]QOJ79694.1 tRNA pseudouridine(13) synthase TruD [Infirmifilum lucidum]